MKLLGRIKKQGLDWFLRRSLKEFSAPTTKPGILLRKITRPVVLGFGSLAGGAGNRDVGADEDTLHVFYDLEVEPVTFDFAPFMAMADSCRQLRGLNKLHVIFVPGRREGLREEDADYEKVVTRAHREWRIHNLLFPIASLLPSCTGYTWCDSRKQARVYERARYRFPDGYTVTFPVYTSFADWPRYHEAGALLRVFKASEEGLSLIRNWCGPRAGDRPIVTITLRHYGFMGDRNSDLAAWAAVARGLRERGYFVVIVPDLDQALIGLPEEFSRFDAFPEACWNLPLRMALYRSAFQNLFVNSGPASLCHFSDASYMMFKIVTQTVPQATEEILRSRNLVLGETPTFAGPNQEWIWKDDRSDTILSAFDAMVARMGSVSRGGAGSD